MPSPNTACPRLPFLWKRCVAAGMAGLVFLLGLLAVHPDAHAWLHGGLPQATGHGHAGCNHDHPEPDAPEADAGCVITQFANGQLGLELDGLIVANAAERTESLLRERSHALVEASDHLLPPVCGPPAA